MAYEPAGLRCMNNSTTPSQWVLYTQDALATAVGSGYVTDAGPTNSGKGAPGRGLKFGDLVMIYSGTNSATVPTTITKVTPAFVSALNATTGAATLTAVALS